MTCRGATTSLLFPIVFVKGRPASEAMSQDVSGPLWRFVFERVGLGQTPTFQTLCTISLCNFRLSSISSPLRTELIVLRELSSAQGGRGDCVAQAPEGDRSSAAHGSQSRGLPGFRGAPSLNFRPKESSQDRDGVGLRGTRPLLIAYADTGFLGSLYGQDDHSPTAASLVRSRPVFLFIANALHFGLWLRDASAGKGRPCHRREAAFW